MSNKFSARNFIKDSVPSGVLLVACTSISLIVANGSFAAFYVSFFSRDLGIPAGGIHLPGSLLHIINDLLMSVFFFSAGLEIKREIMTGELNSFRKSLMPLLSATGGMLLPALIYLAWCHDGSSYRGWGIPMATDIAFSLGVLALLGRRAHPSMRVFLTAIAIIDDIGGIIAIAFFYSGSFHPMYLILSGIALAVLFTLNRLRVTRTYLYMLAGLFLWYFIYNSGVHATIAGVLLALTIPQSCIHKLEEALQIPVNFFILPIFALVNTAIPLPGAIISTIVQPIHCAVFTGLVLGKPLGIFLFTWLALKMKIADIPGNISLKQVLGLGMIAGIGFTVSIFITGLAFTDEHTQTIAKLAIINASVFSGIAGYCFLRCTRRKQYGK